MVLMMPVVKRMSAFTYPSKMNELCQTEIGIFIAEQPAPAPHLAHPEGCAAQKDVLPYKQLCHPLRARGCALGVYTTEPLSSLQPSNMDEFCHPTLGGGGLADPRP